MKASSDILKPCMLLKNMNFKNIDELLKLSNFIIKKVLRKIWLALKIIIEESFRC
jgi:hypothetical protein